MSRYGDLKNVLQTISTGASIPSYIDTIFKLVLGKMAKRKLQSRLKLATIVTGAATSFVLGTDQVLDFMGLKTDAANGNKSVYYLDASGNPVYMPLKPYSFFKVNINAGFCSLVGNTLYIGTDENGNIPATIYFQYYSRYLVLDADGTTEKETPSASEDTFLYPPEFDDVLIDGVLLYLTRREKQDKEYYKAREQWNQSLSDLTFYN